MITDKRIQNMKLRYFIPTLMAVFAMLVSCSSEFEASYLGEVQVSQSYVGLPANGGSITIDVNASDSWAFADVPAWLTVSPASGAAGKTQVTFTAGAATATNEATVVLSCGGKTQEINVIQMTEKVDLPVSTCAQVIAGEDGKTFRTSGVCTAIANTTYGNWYINDGTGEVYIYGTLDAGGNEKNFLSLGLEVGDIVTVEGPKTTYGGTVELVNVTVINIEKSLIKCDSLSSKDPLPLEGGEITAFLTCKGNGVTVEIPDEAKSWLSVIGITANNTSAEVKFLAAANAGGDRSTVITFKTSDGKKDYTSEATISQKGAIVECSVADFLAAEVGDTQYRVTGVITKVAKAAYGNVYIKDHTGEAYVYGIGAKGDFEALGLKEGDVVTLVGKRGEYKGDPQMTGAQYESHIDVQPISIADFKNLEDNKNAYYMISGTITEATEDGTKNDVEKYGNFNLTDESGSVYIYGVLKGWGGAKGEFGELGLTWGDKLTIIAYKTSYKGLVEGVGVYFSSEKAAE